MSTEIKKEIALEIAHVLFIDIVGYSKLSINDQNAAVEELNQVVRDSDQLQRAEAASRLLKIATGDGMALVFYTSPESPAHCAVEISRARREHPRLQLRMGIHSGPVSGVIDVNDRPNLAGAGLNMAQRVMACGDAGHILVSKHVAEDLEEYDQWRPLLHDLGSTTIRIGTVGTQNATFIAGISGVTVASGVGVIVNPQGQLGTVVSSARFKEAIKPMDRASEAILALQPVTFRYKQELDPDGVPQFGLVAEQVEKVNPDLVARDADGKAYTVRYDAVNAMLLNEFLKEHKKVEEQGATIAQMKKQIEALTATVQKVSDQIALSKTAPQLVANP
jgi:endosialidase-like protein/adenylate/guanylate cyclase family protein